MRGENIHARLEKILFIYLFHQMTSWHPSSLIGIALKCLVVPIYTHIERFL